jgi:hypothetical protein
VEVLLYQALLLSSGAKGLDRISTERGKSAYSPGRLRRTASHQPRWQRKGASSRVNLQTRATDERYLCDLRLANDLAANTPVVMR